ncbi:MAG: D-2-hydroxyacid dehydrogenase [Dehalococcoidia bacterium]
MPTILVPADIAARLHDQLAAFDGLEVIASPEGDGAVLPPDVMERLEAAFFNVASGPVASRRILGAARRAPNLRWLHMGHSGADDPIFQELMDRGVTVTNSAGLAAEPIAQSAIAGLLALNRGIPAWLEAQRRHAWEQTPRELPPDQQPPVLGEQTMVILGLGAIGGFVARYARTFGIHVVGVRRSPAGPEDGVDEWLPPGRLAEVLPRTGILVSTIPLTGETRGLLDAAALDLLPAGAVFINVSRGEIVDQGALIERLASGRIAGAYLDVTDPEPLPADSPLWDLPNVILSPHDSARSAGAWPRIDAIFLEEVARWLRGEPSERAVRDR